MIENRKFYRLPFYSKVAYTTNSAALTGYSSNLSCGGLFIKTNNLSAIDSNCWCLFQFKANQSPLKIKGTVRRVVASTFNKDLIEGIGVEFSRQDEFATQLKQVENYIDNSYKNLKLAYSMLSESEPNIMQLNKVLDDLYLPHFNDIGELRNKIDSLLYSIEFIAIHTK